jgi:amidohydrolase
MKSSPGISRIKKAVIDRIDSESPALRELSLKIHDMPELGLAEFKASAWLAKYLKANGFVVEMGICDMPTAFRAVYGKGKPAIGLLAEYDALAGVGHACGHNIICTIAVGAAVAAKEAVDRFGGRVEVIGTPGEEVVGGKIPMTNKGAFNDLDAAMLVHPETIELATSNALACQNLTVEFFGKAAHASANAEKGINALEAMILSYNAINSLRQHIRATGRIHGIITDGGQAANVVPEHSAAFFMVRAADDAYLNELQPKVINCFRGAAEATGARLEYKWDELRYAAMKMNTKLAQAYADNLKITGRIAIVPAAGPGAGSTDMGNVSQVVPAIHPMIAIAPRTVTIHSREFAQAAASEEGMRGLCDGAKAVAMTVTDLLSNPELLTGVREEFLRTD